ncbi:spore gernimation protein GerC [Bacillus sp. AFS076308]|uniref:Ger(x)C family spore germination protein n=1 Tax=unclassified Bacillus (in: firmicutes) TaxID=185979 RepID=UPI000BF5B301|nr:MULTISPECIES: Ger(x)C family spore germination protein [unclassified Bacillus (in: firmicutes)]PFN97288.1 spore gernimation protein GerC [Bacillus sp. AFS076308]PGV51718.1 spore gernimation protein GerC [Bacillus sp. AFS037270]
MKKLGILVINCMIIFVLTGCWSRIEINDITIVTATAIDKMNDGKIRVSLQVAIPKQLGPVGAGGSVGSNGSTVIISETGESMMDAIRRLQEKLPRRIFFSHNRILIIGEKAAKDGVYQILDYISRVREARMRSFILFSKGEAASILRLTPVIERYSSEAIREQEKTGVGAKIMIKDFFNMLTTEGISPVAAEVAIRSEEKGRNSSKETAAIVGSAVFHKDKLVGWINDKDTRGVLWIRNEMVKGNITVSIPKEKGGGKISAELKKGRTKVKPILVQSNVKMNVNIQAQVEVFENSSKLDLGNPKVLQYVQTLLEKDVEKRCELALFKAQKQYRTDIFGFGNAVYRNHPKAWKEQHKNKWTEEFPNLEVSVNPHVSIVRTGLSVKSPEMKD